MEVVSKLYNSFQGTAYYELNVNAQDGDAYVLRDSQKLNFEGRTLNKAFGVLRTHASGSRHELAAQLSLVMDENKELPVREMPVIHKLAFMQIIIQDDRYGKQQAQKQQQQAQQQQRGGFVPLGAIMTGGGIYLGIMVGLLILGCFCSMLCSDSDIFCFLSDLLFGAFKIFAVVPIFVQGGGGGKPSVEANLNEEYVTTSAFSLSKKQREYENFVKTEDARRLQNQNQNGMVELESGENICSRWLLTLRSHRDNYKDDDDLRRQLVHGMGMIIVTLATFLDIDASYLANVWFAGSLRHNELGQNHHEQRGDGMEVILRLGALVRPEDAREPFQAEA